MPSEDASPSAGWREVYDAMGTEADDDPDLRADGCGERREPQAGSENGSDRGCGERRRSEPCPDCGAVPGVDAGDVCCGDHLVDAGD